MAQPNNPAGQGHGETPPYLEGEPLRGVLGSGKDPVSRELVGLDFQHFQDRTFGLDFWTFRLDFWTSRLDFLGLGLQNDRFWTSFSTKIRQKRLPKRTSQFIAVFSIILVEKITDSHDKTRLKISMEFQKDI
mgnify:CR=1 FL=1